MRWGILDDDGGYFYCITYIDAVRRIYLEGATLREIAPDFLPMLGVAAVAMPLAGWLFRKRS